MISMQSFDMKVLKECIAEYIGTLMFVGIGLSSVATMVLKLSDVSYSFMALAWGIAIAFAIYLVGSISGAHMNPAVTIALTIWSGFEKKKAVFYIIAQIMGAFSAAAIVYLIFQEGIISFEGANGWIRGTAEGTGAMGIFVTSSSLALWKAFLVEVIDTMILVFTIYAVTDKKNTSAPSSGLGAVAIGISVTLCGIALGPLTGFAMNTARDLGPRLFLAIAGWGQSAWGNNLYGIIVPIFAPIVGGILAGGLYTKIIVKIRKN